MKVSPALGLLLVRSLILFFHNIYAVMPNCICNTHNLVLLNQPLGLAISHFLDVMMPPPCEENPPLGLVPIVLGLVGVVALDKLMKKLPEYPDGTRDFWSLTLTMLGFSAIMVYL